MRLLLACLSLFLAPAAALFVTDRYASGMEDEFLADARSHVARMNRVAEFYPPNVAKMQDAPAIQQLKKMGLNGEAVAANVCGASGAFYQRLFEGLTARCGDWVLLRRARRAALFSVVFTVAVFAIVLVSRIRVERAVARQQWRGDWGHRFILRGIPYLILAQSAASIVGYYIVIQTVTGKALFATGIVALPFAALFWIERRLVLAFVEPRALAALRPTRSAAPQPPPERPKYVIR
jgi:hypothetical protein